LTQSILAGGANAARLYERRDMADAQSAGMFATLVPVVIGGVIALAGTWLGPWISERHKERQEKKKVRTAKFEELVASVYEFDGWLDKERDANFANETSKQGLSPFAKLDAIAAVHFPQFDGLIQQLDQEAAKYIVWMNQTRVDIIKGTLGADPLDGYAEIIRPYTAVRNKLLEALRGFAHKEFQ
jgi:hypothetical protein